MDVCLKVYNKRQLSTESVGAKISRSQVDSEVRNHAKATWADHPNILSLYGAFEDAKALVLVMEFCPCGSVRDLLEKGSLPISHAQRVISGLMAAASHLHSLQIIHCDLKPENLLLTSDGDIKVADFGLSLDLTLEKPFLATGSLSYCAPEVVSYLLSDEAGGRCQRTTAADVWSCGAIAFELLAGRCLFCSSTDRTCCILNIARGISAHELDGFPPEATDFILKAMMLNPKTRPSSAMLKKHRWLDLRHSHKQLPMRWLSELMLGRGLQLTLSFS